MQYTYFNGPRYMLNGVLGELLQREDISEEELAERSLARSPFTCPLLHLLPPVAAFYFKTNTQGK